MAVLFGVYFRSFGVMMKRVLTIPVSQVCVVRRLFVLLGLIVFRRFVEMISSFLVVPSGVMVMLPSLRHVVLLRNLSLIAQRISPVVLRANGAENKTKQKPQPALNHKQRQRDSAILISDCAS
jgi:hypothetical protein